MTTQQTTETRIHALQQKQSDKTQHKFLTRIPFVQLDPYHPEQRLQPSVINDSQPTDDTPVITTTTDTTDNTLQQQAFSTLSRHLRDIYSTNEELTPPYTQLIDEILGDTAEHESQFLHILDFNEQLPEHLEQHFEPDPDFIILVTDIFSTMVEQIKQYMIHPPNQPSLSIGIHRQPQAPQLVLRTTSP
jgi:hypothetical protein